MYVYLLVACDGGEEGMFEQMADESVEAFCCTVVSGWDITPSFLPPKSSSFCASVGGDGVSSGVNSRVLDEFDGCRGTFSFSEEGWVWFSLAGVVASKVAGGMAENDSS